MLIKIYSIISMMSIITNLKIKYDIWSNKELVAKMLKSEMGIDTLYVYRSIPKIIIKSLIPIIHLHYVFMGSFLFITDFFNNEGYVNKFLQDNKEEC